MQGTTSQRGTSHALPDVWRLITAAALAAEGNSLAAWMRLSMVSRAWHDSLAGRRCPASICDGWARSISQSFPPRHSRWLGGHAVTGCHVMALQLALWSLSSLGAAYPHASTQPKP